MAHHLMTDSEIRRVAPSVFAEQPHESRGDRYAYIPTIQVLEGLRKEGFEVTNAQQTRCRVAGKSDFTKHLLRLRHRSAIDQPLVVGREIPEVVLVNSHDGTSSYQLMAGIYRVVCSNGMIVGDTSHEVRVRHSGNVIDNVIEGSYSVIEGIQQVMPVIDDWKAIQLLPAEREAYADSARLLRWGDEDEAPVTASTMLSARRFEDHKADLWTTFNVVQENVLRGGLRGRNKSNRRMTTRAVNGVTENVRLNKALWQLTESMAKIKQAA